MLRTSSLEVPGLVVGASAGEKLEKDRGHLKALVPVQRWFGFEDLHCFSDFSGIVVGFTSQNSHIVKRKAVSRTFDVFKHSRLVIRPPVFAEALAQGAGSLSYVKVIAGTTGDLVNGPTLVFFLLLVFGFHQE